MEYLFQALRRRRTIKELRHYDAEGTWWPSMSPARVAAMQHPALPSELRRVLEYVEFMFIRVWRRLAEQDVQCYDSASAWWR